MVDPQPDAFFSPAFQNFPDATGSAPAELPAVMPASPPEPAMHADPTSHVANPLPLATTDWYVPPPAAAAPMPWDQQPPAAARPASAASPAPVPRAPILRQASGNPPQTPWVPNATWQPTGQPTQQPAITTGGGWRKKAGGAAAGTGLLAKILLTGKTFALFALHFKTAASMLVSVAVYAVFWGWKFAIGFVAMLFVHEMGHVVVLRKQGVKATAPMFIPFFGAFVKIKGVQRSVAQEATSALAGPAAGLAASGFVLLLADTYHSPLLKALAYTGFLINLFNLIPALPLDGGRVAGAVHPAIWFGGLAAAAVYLVYLRSPLILFLLVIGVPETIRRWRARRAGTDNAYMSIPTEVRWRIAGAYLAVAAMCMIGMDASFTSRHF